MAKKKKIKRHKKPHKSVVMAVSYRQKGRSKSPRRDRMWKALPPGKRVSPSGKIYYEYRANRSDVDPRLMKKLPKVGSSKKKSKKKKK